jgi:hypothetical protein
MLPSRFFSSYWSAERVGEPALNGWVEVPDTGGLAATIDQLQILALVRRYVTRELERKGQHPAHASSAIMITIGEHSSPAERVNDHLSLLRQSGFDVVTRSDNG